jgi:hypothetical protein
MPHFQYRIGRRRDPRRARASDASTAPHRIKHIWAVLNPGKLRPWTAGPRG